MTYPPPSYNPEPPPLSPLWPTLAAVVLLAPPWAAYLTGRPMVAPIILGVISSVVVLFVGAFKEVSKKR